MSERAIFVSGFEALPADWPKVLKTTRDVVLVSDREHLVGVRPYRGGHTLIASRLTRREVEERSFPFHNLTVRGDDATHQALVVVDRDGFGLAASPDLPAPFDRYAIGGERLSDHPAA